MFSIELSLILYSRYLHHLPEGQQDPREGRHHPPGCFRYLRQQPDACR